MTGQRIALLTEKYPPEVGGLAVSAARLARLLSQGPVPFDVHVFCLTTRLEAGRQASEVREGITIHWLGEHKKPEDSLSAWYEQVVEQHRLAPFDLLQAYFITKAGFVGVYAGRTLGVPCIASARGNDLERAVFDPGRAGHSLYALQHASLVTANASHLAAKARALAPGQEVVLVPNGVDSEQFCPAPADADLAGGLGIAPGEAVIGFAGEARAKKGLAALLLAFRQVASRRPAALLLAGGVRPGEDEALVRVFQKQNPGLKVLVTPYVPQAQLAGYYGLMDVLALPSLRDGLPNALLEGMACGRAVMAAPVGGMVDAIVDGENGLFAPPGDPDGLAAAIERLLDDPGLRQRLGAAARRTVLARFTLQQELEANLALYRRLMGGPT